jgi:hypothetical protein
VEATRRMVDPRQPRFGQFLTGTGAALAFVFGWPQLFVALALILGLGALSPRTNLWVYLYRVFKRAAGLGPPEELEDAAPPRFAMELGFAAFSIASVLYFAGGSDAPGLTGFQIAAYAIDGLIIGLGYLGAAGLCVGCEIYLWIKRAQARRQTAVGV